MKKYTYTNWLKVAHRLDTAEEARDCFAKLHLEGKTIKSIRILGHDYDHSTACYREKWNDYCRQNNIQKKDISTEEMLNNVYNLIPDDAQCWRSVTLNEPLIMEFTDGQRLEMDADMIANEIRLSVNEIPLDAIPTNDPNNIDGNVIFSSCLGKTITEIEFLWIKEFESVFQFNFNDGTSFRVYGQPNFCYYELEDNGDYETKDVEPISWGELKKGLRNI